MGNPIFHDSSPNNESENPCLDDVVKQVLSRRKFLLKSGGSAAAVAFLIVLIRVFKAQKFGHSQATTAIVVSYYWHFVDIVWIALFTAIYLILARMSI